MNLNHLPPELLRIGWSKGQHGLLPQFAAPPPKNMVAMAVNHWPKLAGKIARWQKPSDRGIGDTLERIFGQPGKAFQVVAKKLGVSCGCAAARDWLNQRFPYPENAPLTPR